MTEVPDREPDELPQAAAEPTETDEEAVLRKLYGASDDDGVYRGVRL